MKKILKKIKKSEAFTLLEMAIVLFIVSVLLLLVIPNISTQRNAANEQGDEALETVVQTQVQLYEMQNGELPGSLEALEGDYLSRDQINRANAAGIGVSP